MAKKNMELVYEIEEMIKKYNKKPDKKVKKKDIINLLHNVDIIVAMKADFEESEIFDEYLDGVSMKPDIVKNGNRLRLLPLFTSYEQIPADYRNTFSMVKMPATFAYSFMNECEDLDGMVLNPFTELNLELKKKKDLSKSQLATKHYNKAVSYEEPEAMVIYNNKKYPIQKIPFVIGRENADICIPESYISKIHVVISYKEGKYRIADYDSTNGTTLNGTPLRPKVYYELRDGYVIELAEEEKMVVYIN